MNVSSTIAGGPPKAVTAPEAREDPRVPDHDGDADDAALPVETKAPPAPGTGAIIDKMA